MALAPGTRLGPYEITAPLGAGGMGEVYRATDTNLKRQVAIKVLPEAFAQDLERLARFEREAKTLASLNHPNIAIIHGLEKADGVRALVMELVEGPTLADRIAQGPIPLDETLPIAKQMAEALEAAHEQGIIHRDLKPANIKVRPDGTVKVLDFGLAKAMEPQAAGSAVSAGLSQSPTITTPAMTQMGMILGTAAYMSPEQARGRPVDKRTDIWAFGCVLYEMLTGERAFQAEDVSLTLADVMKSDPDLGALPPLAPPGVHRALRLCLQKNPRQRGGDMAAIRLALEGVFDTGAGPAAGPAANPPFWRRALPMTAAFVAGGAVIGLAVWSFEEVPATLNVSRHEYRLPAGKAFRNVGRSVMAISPDGRALVYNTSEGLYLRLFSEMDARLIPGTEEALVDPIFSPDSQSISYVTLTRELKRVAVSGGQPVPIANLTPFRNVFGSTWATDGTIFLGVDEGIVRVSSTGGSPELVVRAAEGESVYGPQLLPDGYSVLFSVTRGPWNQGASGEVVVHSLRTGTRTTVLKGGSDARYLPSGHLVYALRNGLFAVPFDTGRLTTAGGSSSVVQGIARSGADVTGAANYGVSRQGTLVYLPDFGLGLRQMRWFDRNGAPLATVGSPSIGILNLVLAPDETRVAFQQVGGQPGLWLTDISRNVTSLLAAPGSDPNWSPNGRELAFSRGQEGTILMVSAAGGTPKVVFKTPDGQPAWVEDWHPSGQVLAGHLQEPARTRGIVITTQGTASPVIFDQANDLDEAHFSPDGKWIAYNAERDGRGWEVYVMPYPPTGERIQVSSGGGMQARWRADGRELYYMRPDGTLMSVAIGLGFVPAAPTPLFQTGLVVDPVRDQYAVSRDGKRFLISVPAPGEGSQPRFIIVQNWLEELKRLVPAN